MVLTSALPTSASTHHDTGKLTLPSLCSIDESDSVYEEPPHTLLSNLSKIAHLTKCKLPKELVTPF